VKQTLMRRKVLSFIAYLVLALIIAYIISHRYTPSLDIGATAPLDAQLSKLNKPLLINFWATWCSPCEQELPIINKLSQKFNNITFVGLVIDSNKEDINFIKNKLNINYIIYETTSSTVKKWHAELLPTTYLIDSQGKIAWAHAGLIQEKELEKALKMLK